MKLLYITLSVFFVVSFHLHSQTTFNKDVAPIVFKHCVSCHRDGEIAPFPLSNYEEVSQMALTVRAVTKAGTMPPWKAEKSFGNFLDERILTAEEKEVIDKWIEQGLEEGNLADLPKLPDFPKGSQLGTPDLVLQLKSAWKINGDFKDSYRNFVLDIPIDKDYEIAAVEFRPGNTKVVHHALMWLDTTGEAMAKDNASPEDGYEGFGGPGFTPTLSYGGWVPGAASRFYPPGIGNKMFKNGKIVVQIHYAASATEEFDQSTINIFYKKNEPSTRQILEYSMAVNELVTKPFQIPANEKKAFKASYFVPLDVSLYSVAPHQHLLGTSAKAYAVTTLGDTIPLVSIPRWDFNWQGAFTFQKFVKIPMFSTLYYEAEYDNTIENPFNPNNPPLQIQWGERTVDEMFLCYFNFLPYEQGDELIELGPKNDTTISSVSNFEIIGFPKAMITEIYPNPAQSENIIRFYNPTYSTISVSINSLDGKFLGELMKPLLYPIGHHSISLQFKNILSGKYFIQLQSSNGIHTIPITILR